MQAKERRQTVVLLVLLAVLAALVWWQLGGAIRGSGTPTTAGAAAPVQARPAGRPPAAAEAGPVVVHLAWLEQARPEPEIGPRDPFAFGGAAESPTAAASTAGPGGGQAIAAPELPEGPPEPAPPPPIPFRYIGLLDAPGTGEIAVLSDGRFVYHGREGDIIDGRYRLVSVSSSSVQLEYLDGRGRQTLRMSGS